MIYNIFNDNKPLIKKLFNAGIIPVGVFTSYERYQYFLDARALKIRKRKAVEMTMDYFNCSEKTVYNSINMWG